jgi:hypothetical protein
MPAPLDRNAYGALALAGVVQAAALVHRTAHGDGVPDEARNALLRTVPTRNADDLARVFPDPASSGSAPRWPWKRCPGRAARRRCCATPCSWWSWPAA